ncbi:MAG TPA: sigma-70 family RNA polymerase sigma factor [Chitinophagaceae bacterium]|nr:sigma-70 family RNA polymerase sigma factor [Chitinophagaceae bacterium]
MTQQEFLELVDRHGGLIRKVCRLYCDNPQDRQDLYQEIVLQLWRSLPGFRQQSQVSTWMYRVALNTAITDLRRSRNRVRTTRLEDLEEEPADSEETARMREQTRLLQEAIRRLSDIDKAIVLLYLEQHSYEEMEAVLGMSQNHLRVKMNRIREKLRNLTKTPEHGT